MKGYAPSKFYSALYHHPLPHVPGTWQAQKYNS